MVLTRVRGFFGLGAVRFGLGALILLITAAFMLLIPIVRQIESARPTDYKYKCCLMAGEPKLAALTVAVAAAAAAAEKKKHKQKQSRRRRSTRKPRRRRKKKSATQQQQHKKSHSHTDGRASGQSESETVTYMRQNDER